MVITRHFYIFIVDMSEALTALELLLIVVSHRHDSKYGEQNNESSGLISLITQYLPMLATGQPAPDFELPNQEGESVRLADFEGQRVVLYFYPRADTPGCTKEACGFRDTWDGFEDHDITVLGVSNDSITDLAAFKAKYDLPFTLLSDPDGDVASTYESYGTREIQGEEWEIAFRNTYLIDEDGRITQVYENVSPEGHAKEILTGLR